MEQPRICHPLASPQGITHRKQGLTPADQQECEEPFPVQSLAKHFENSVGFSETYNSNSRSWGFMKGNQTRLPEDEKQSKAEQLKPEQKPKISQIRQQGRVQGFRALLPSHLATKLHPSYEQLLRLASQVDGILAKRESLNFMESFSNLRAELLDCLSQELSDCMFSRINWLVPNFYLCKRDPLGNFVIGLPPRCDSLPMRKFLLRKQLHSYALQQSGQTLILSEVCQPIPERSLKPGKITTFFPEVRKKRVHKQSLLSKSFISQITERVNQKQEEISGLGEQEEKALLRFGIDEFIDKLGQLFREHKVSHIYRASVIAWFQKQGMTTGSVLSWLRTIEGLGLYLHPSKMGQKPLIYELRPEEEAPLRKRLAARY